METVTNERRHYDGNKKIHQEFSVCQVEDYSFVNLDSEYSFFSLIGILSKIAAILADHNIPIFAVSTYNTDYLLVKKEDYEKAIQALEAAGYKIIE